MTRAHPRGADRAAIRRLLRPRSVAILGVSATPTALGSAVLRNLDRAGYAGEIHLINPKYAELHGRPCLKSVDDLPDGVDCVVLAIPRAAVLDVLAACGRKGIGGAIVFSAGFAEAGESGRADQARIAEIARAHGMAVEGPNCLGMVNYVDGAPLTFVDIPVHRPQDGTLQAMAGMAILSQSGAMAAVLTVGLRRRGLNLAYSVSTGNEAASGIEDYLEELLDDPQVPVIAMIVEQFRQPGRFLALAERARALGKRLVLLHPGRSSAARASAATHTGAMVGDYQVMRTKVTHAGVVVVDRLEMLLDVAEVMARCPTLPQGGAAVMTESGAFKAVTLDLCDEVGLDLPPIGAATAALLRAALPDFIPPTNPLDLTAQALVDPDLYNRTLPALLDDDAYGAVLMGIILSDPETCALKFPAILSAIRRLRPEKPLIFAGLDEGADVPPAYVDELRALGVPFFPTAERALAAIACLARTGQADRAAPVESMPSMALSPGVIPEYRAKAILQTIGIPIPEGDIAGTLGEAQAIAERVGYPVALKAQSSALSHKSDVGGVVLGLATATALAEGWDRLHRAIGAARPGLVLDGVLVEAMGRKGTELIVGARNDPDWGPVLLVGLGGVLAEALGDVRLLPPDLGHEAIVAELYRLKAGALLRGFRGGPPLDVEAAARIVARLGAFMLANPAVAEVDINPVMLLPAGEGALALDALIAVE